jgi:WhiB family redox-sensing transcriptional regulator
LGQARSEVDIRWTERAACDKTPKDLFYVEDRYDEQSEEYRAYKADLTESFCQACPVREACFNFSIENNEEWGIWAGADRLQRRRWKRQGVPAAEAYASLTEQESDAGD